MMKNPYFEAAKAGIQLRRSSEETISELKEELKVVAAGLRTLFGREVLVSLEPKLQYCSRGQRTHCCLGSISLNWNASVEDHVQLAHVHVEGASVHMWWSDVASYSTDRHALRTSLINMLSSREVGSKLAKVADQISSQATVPSR